MTPTTTNPAPAPTPNPPPSPASPTAATPPAHILVVDDVEKNTRLLADLLGARGYRTSTASSGAQALAQIDATPPDLVLLDVMMPGMSGYEVCQTLRADPRHGLLPVVLVTALDPAIERIKGLDAGADDFLNKPINQAELLARVRSLLRVKTLQDQLLRERQATPAPALPTHHAAAVALHVAWPDLPGDTAGQDPGALLAAVQALQDRVAGEAVRLGGVVAGCGGAGMAVLFNVHPPHVDATRHALRCAAGLQALGAGLAIGVAQGSATVGLLRLPDGGSTVVALGSALQRAEQLSHRAAAGEVLASTGLTTAPRQA